MFNANPAYPATRLRRTRMHEWSRRLVQEHHLHIDDLIWPIFIIDGENKLEPIPAMPGVNRMTIDKAVEATKEAQALGIPVIALFPVTPTKLKTDDGEEALNPDNLMCRALRAIKSACPDIGLLADVALDPYTTHGQDGVLMNEIVANDATVEILTEQALIQTQAGADIIAPSDMQDGRIGAIRQTLEQQKLHHTLIMSYAAKYASHFYGPFRHAVGSATNTAGKKDKRNYQMSFANTDEALREVALDISEGADMVMVKPGMPYLDVIQRVKSTFQMPTFAYQVSGEYSMLKLAIDQGILSQDAILESLLGFKRAGCDGILTYFALEVAKVLHA